MAAQLIYTLCRLPWTWKTEPLTLSLSSRSHLIDYFVAIGFLHCERKKKPLLLLADS